MRRIFAALTFVCAAPLAIAQCVAAGPAATSYGAGDEVVVNGGVGIDLGFAFPLGGATYQFVHPSTNGFCYLSDGAAPITDADQSPSAVEMAGNAPRVAVLWDDLDLIAGNGAALFVDTSVAGQCTVTWQDVVAHGETPQMTVQCTLSSSGVVELAYDARAYHTTAAIAGVSPGNGTAQPAPTDLSAGLPSSSAMTYEEFPSGALDLVGSSCSLVPTAPGFLPVLAGAGCATTSTLGEGCVSLPDARYELFAATAGGAAAPDIMASGTAVTFLRTGDAYLVSDTFPGTYVPPSPNAAVVATGDDDFGAVALSQPMPVPGGATNSLQVATNGYIHLTDSVPGGGSDYSPTVAEFEAFGEPTICGAWYDWSPNQAGQLLAEEVNGVAYVTWAAVQAYGVTAADTFQFQFDVATGDCTIVYESMTFGGDRPWHTPLFGATAGSPSYSVAVDWSASLPTGQLIGDVSILPLTLDAGPPSLGGTWDLTTSNIDAASPVAVTVLSDVPGAGLPFAAIGLNAPGCSVWVGAVVGNLVGANVGGGATVSLPVPSHLALQGATVVAQSVCLSLANPANLLASNSALGTVGQ